MVSIGIMKLRIQYLRLVIGIFFALATLLIFVATGAAQTVSAPAVSDFLDTRFQGVTEDWTTPSLSKSHLQPISPVVGFADKLPKYSVELVRVQWRKADPIDLWIMKPAGVAKPPVILYLYGYPSDTDTFRDPKTQEFLTRDGVAAVGFVSALTGGRYHNRPMKQWFLSELQESMAESTHDVQMIINYLASRGDLDMDRVGMFAQLSGASIGILASAVDPRIRVLDTFDPWGDWPAWMEKSPFVPKDERANYEQPEFLNKLATLEPLEWMPKIQAQKFRLQQRHFEGETPFASKEKLQAAAPSGATVVMYKTHTEFGAAIGSHGDKALDWITKAVKSLPPPAPANAVAAGKVN
jgi:hypothetical protein